MNLYRNHIKSIFRIISNQQLRVSLRLLSAAATLCSPEAVGATPLTTLQVFTCSETSPSSPQGPVVLDTKKDLFGTTRYGGNHGVGTFFKLTYPTYTPTVVANFGSYAPEADVGQPSGALARYSNFQYFGAGLLDGTSVGICPNGGCGSIYGIKTNKLNTYSVYHQFQGLSDGATPIGGLARDQLAPKTYYGATEYGGDGTTNFAADPGHGTIYQVIAGKTGLQQYQIIYTVGTGPGGNPAGTPVESSAGNLYFVGYFGDVVELIRPQPGGVWTAAVVASGTGASAAGVTLDETGKVKGQPAGAVYGVNFNPAPGGSTDYGDVYQLLPPASGQGPYTIKYLYVFGDTGDGVFPMASLIISKKGTLLGTTEGTGRTGDPGRYGNVFELLPPSAGGTAWALKVLHTFKGPDGGDPLTPLVASTSGDYFGSTSDGTPGSVCGTVFELSP